MLLDESGEVVDAELFAGDLPSVIVDLSVLPMKSVSVDVESAILGMDSLASGYEITSITCDPERVNIVGEQSVLDGISSISLVAYSVSNADKDINVLLDYAPLEGVSVLETTQAQVYITIREISDVVSYKDVDIVVKNVPHGLTAQLETQSIDVVVMAGVSKLSQLERGDIVPYIDLEGYETGTYTLSIQYELPDGFAAENFSSGVETVTVTLTR
jgi:YbbR domain-containing protein